MRGRYPERWRRAELRLRELPPVRSQTDPVGKAFARLREDPAPTCASQDAAERRRALRLDVRRAVRWDTTAALVGAAAAAAVIVWTVWISDLYRGTDRHRSKTVPTGEVAHATSEQSIANEREPQGPSRSMRMERPLRRGRLVVLGARGRAKIERGKRSVAVKGRESLVRGDILETSPDDEVTFRIDRGADISVRGRSRVRVDSTPSGIAVLDVLRGRLEARGQGQQRATLVRIRHRGANVDLMGGSLGVLRSHGNRLAVASLMSADSVVRLNGRRVRIPAGYQIRLDDTGKPAAPEPLPRTLRLDLKQLEPSQGNSRDTIRITGAVDPYVLLVINGRDVAITPSGGFIADLSVSARRRRMHATVVDAAGRSKTVSRDIERVSSSWRWHEPG